MKKTTEETIENGHTADPSATAECPSGKLGTGGGAYTEGVAGPLLKNGPVLSSMTYNKWLAVSSAHNESGSTAKAVPTAVIYCIDGP